MLYAWGSGNNGQLGVVAPEKDKVDSWLPLSVSFCQSGVRRVAAGSSHSLAVSNGTTRTLIHSLLTCVNQTTNYLLGDLERMAS